jgi:reverse gyrase
MIDPVYSIGCPNCNGPITASRASVGLVCNACLPYVNIDHFKNLNLDDKVKLIYNLLIENNTLKYYWEIYYYYEDNKEIYKYFKNLIGNEPWALQKLWLRRLKEGLSFSMTAPTGMGKTTTLLVYSLYKNKDTLFIVPTRSLLEQICQKIEKYGGKVSCGDVSSSISIITFNYLNRNFEKIRNLRPSLILVDDADAIVKSGKTTDKVVELLGIDRATYESAIKLVKLKRLYMIYKDDGKGKEILEEIKELESRIAKIKPSGQLVVASATLRPKGIKQKALKYLTGFELSTGIIYARNIIDSYAHQEDLEGIITELGQGGLILVSKEYGKNKLTELSEKLSKLGFKVEKALTGRNFLKKLQEGNVDIIIGSANYYGIAVRGIDEPKKIKYVVFYGIPKNRIRVEEAVKNPIQMTRVGKALGIDLSDIELNIRRLTPTEIQILGMSLKKDNVMLPQKLYNLKLKILNYIDLIKNKIYKTEKIIGESFIIYRDNKEYYFTYPDIITYLQGSGRTSRLLNNGLTLGLSITLVDYEELFEIMKRKLKRIIDEFNIEPISNINLKEIRESLNKSRNSNEGKNQINVKTATLIVESPTKAKTIAKIFGKSAIRQIGNVNVYETVIVDKNNVWVLNIIATKGHIFDLTVDDRGLFGVEVNGNTVSPYYERILKCYNCGKSIAKSSERCPYCNSLLITSSESIINTIRILALESDEVYVATDPDIEGEKIAFDIFAMISPYNLNVFRLKYNEVTKLGIIEALRKPEKINVNLVNGQIVRRIEDRWIGFTLSNFLKHCYNEKNHGAGRVQTPVLKLIVERTKEYKNNLGWILIININDFKIKKYFKNKNNALDFMKELKVNIRKIGERRDILTSPPPFTTETLLEEAYTQLGFPAHLTMKIAQDLFELGFITYHRTDSIRISNYGISIAKTYLEKINKLKEFVGRSWSNEGAHEAIRPTRAIDNEELIREINDNFLQFRIDEKHVKLYDLIFRRFIASQMKFSEIIYGKYEININDTKEIIEVPIKTIGGFSTIYSIKTYDIKEGEINPEVKLIRSSLIPLYDYASIIREMRQRNLGRPSTYVSTIKNLIRHGYVVESKKKSYLIATTKGENALKLLLNNFSDLISEATTVKLLREIDMISNGSKIPEELIMELLGEVQKIIQSSNDSNISVLP